MKYYLGYNNKDGFISLIFKDVKADAIFESKLKFSNESGWVQAVSGSPYEEEYMMYSGITDLLAKLVRIENEEIMFSDLQNENERFVSFFNKIRELSSAVASDSISDQLLGLKNIEYFLEKQNIPSDRVSIGTEFIGMDIGGTFEKNNLEVSVQYPLALTLVILSELLSYFENIKEETDDVLLLESNAEWNYLLTGNDKLPTIFKDLGLEKYIECLDVKNYLYHEILKIKEPELPFD